MGGSLTSSLEGTQAPVVWALKRQPKLGRRTGHGPDPLVLELEIPILSSVELDDLLLFEELREVLSLGQGDDLAGHLLNVGIDVRR